MLKTDHTIIVSVILDISCNQKLQPSEHSLERECVHQSEINYSLLFYIVHRNNTYICFQCLPFSQNNLKSLVFEVKRQILKIGGILELTRRHFPLFF